jgi:hypothetical protein
MRTIPTGDWFCAMTTRANKSVLAANMKLPPVLGHRAADETDATVLSVRHVEITRGVNGETRGNIESRIDGLSSVTGEAADTRTGDSRNNQSCSVHSSDAAVHSVGNEQIACCIKRKSERYVQPGCCCELVVSTKISLAETGWPGTCPGCDHFARGINSSHAMVQRIRDKNVSASIDGKARRFMERG